MELETEEYEQKIRHNEEGRIWKIRVDGLTNRTDSAIGIQIMTLGETELTNSIMVDFQHQIMKQSVKLF